MPHTVSRTRREISTYALVEISPATTTSPVVSSVSHATRPMGSSAMMASRIASEIWSAILSGWPSVTDSEVKVHLVTWSRTPCHCFAPDILSVADVGAAPLRPPAGYPQPASRTSDVGDGVEHRGRHLSLPGQGNMLVGHARPEQHDLVGVVLEPDGVGGHVV